MISRSEIEFRSQRCLAQLKLRVVAFSIALVVPPWVGLYALQKLGVNWSSSYFVRGGGLFLLAVYILVIIRIVRGTQRDCELVCPKCTGLLGPQGGRVNTAGECRKCGEKIVG
jgi:hypothetical protein